MRLRWVVAVGLVGALFAGMAAAQASRDLAGTWQGTLAVGKGERLVVRIAKDGGGWSGMVYNLDSPMAYEGRATTRMSWQGAEVRFGVAPIDVSFEGKLSEDGASLAGNWTQGGQAHPLVLTRAEGDAQWNVPKVDAPMAKDADPDWEVVSVKAHDPDDPSNAQRMGMNGRQFVIVNRPVEGLLLFAYGLHKKELVGAPSWIETERWDAQGVPDVPGEPNLKQTQTLIRKLLEERFGLKAHRESKEMAVYAITVAKGGEKLTRSAGDPNSPPFENEDSNGGVMTMRMTNMSMGEFAPEIGYFLERPAVNQTGLAGRYDFQLKWTADESKAPVDGSAPPGMVTAIQEQLGLKLEPVKAAVEVLVVDKVERPGAN